MTSRPTDPIRNHNFASFWRKAGSPPLISFPDPPVLARDLLPIVENTEVVQHFYSAGFFSIKEDGNLLTDQRIISYWRDPASHELVVASARYEDIQDLQLEGSLAPSELLA